MDGFDAALLAIASFFAGSMLVRMMRQHRDTTLLRLRQQLEAEQQRREAERRKQERAERKRKEHQEKLKYLQELEARKRKDRAA